jgi:hypothetical protein
MEAAPLHQQFGQARDGRRYTPGFVGSQMAVAEVTYYVALPFVANEDGTAAGEPTECFNPNAAVMRAEALSRKEGHVGAVASICHFVFPGMQARDDVVKRAPSALIATK